MFVSYDCCVFSGRALFNGPIPHPEESYRALVCVCVCVCVINYKNNLCTYNDLIQKVRTKKARKKQRKKERELTE